MTSNWEAANLGEVAEFVMGQAPPGSECNKSEIGAAFVKAGEFGQERPVIREWTTRPLKLARASDVLVCVVGATAGKINLGADCAIGRSVAAIRPDQGLDQHFLYRFLSTKVLELRSGSVGSAQGVISKDDLASIALDLPPLPEQRRIVAKIDSVTGKSRRAREHLDHIPRLVEKYKGAVLAAAFASSSTGASYPRATLDLALSDIRYGTAKKCGYGAGDIGVLRIPNIQAGRISLDDMKSASFTASEQRKLSLQNGDVLVIRSNGSLNLVGRSAVVAADAAGLMYAGYLIRLRLDQSMLLPDFLHRWLQSPEARTAIEQQAKSTTGVNNINSTQLENLRLPVPDVDAQAEIVRRIEVAFAYIDRLAAEATSARKLLDRLDQSILAKAFRGELVPQDPNDDPASVLLERIRAERTATPKPKRGRTRKVKHADTA